MILQKLALVVFYSSAGEDGLEVHPLGRHAAWRVSSNTWSSFWSLFQYIVFRRAFLATARAHTLVASYFV